MYRVILPRRVERQLDSLPDEIRPEVMRGLLDLTGEPRPPLSRKLVGYEHTWCAYLPQHYRAYYDIDDAKGSVVVLAIVQSRSGRYLDTLVDD